MTGTTEAKLRAALAAAATALEADSTLVADPDFMGDIVAALDALGRITISTPTTTEAAEPITVSDAVDELVKRRGES